MTRWKSPSGLMHASCTFCRMLRGLQGEQPDGLFGKWDHHQSIHINPNSPHTPHICRCLCLCLCLCTCIYIYMYNIEIMLFVDKGFAIKQILDSPLKHRHTILMELNQQRKGNCLVEKQIGCVRNWRIPQSCGRHMTMVTMVNLSSGFRGTLFSGKAPYFKRSMLLSICFTYSYFCCV